MPTTQDDYNAYTAAKLNIPALQDTAQTANAALNAGLALVTSTAAQVSADLQADGPEYVGPDPTTNLVIFLEYSTDPNSTDPGFNATPVPPASSQPGGVAIPSATS